MLSQLSLKLIQEAEIIEIIYDTTTHTQLQIRVCAFLTTVSLFLQRSFACSYDRQKSHYLACNVCLPNLPPSSDPPSVKLYNNVTSSPHVVPNTQYIYYMESKNESKSEVIMDIFNACFASPMILTSTANTIELPLLEILCMPHACYMQTT